MTLFVVVLFINMCTKGIYPTLSAQRGVKMDWLTSLQKAIDYMEKHIFEDIGAQ